MKLLTRYLSALVIGGVITFLLSAAMIGLIRITSSPVAPDAFESISFIRLERERNLHLEPVKPEPPPQPEVPPQNTHLDLASPARMAPQQLTPGGGPATLGLSAAGISPGSGGLGAGLGPGLGSGFSASLSGGGDYLPIAQVAPQYPREALMQRIEGWVLVEFTIGTEGQVKNPRIISAEPPDIFNRSALDAVQRFRFRPRTVAGTPVEVHGVQNRIRFRLERP